MELIRITKAQSIDIITRNKKDGIFLFVATSDNYRKLTTLLEERNYPYHSFCHPEERAFRVIIKNIPESLCIDEVRELLFDQGFHPKFVQRWKLKSGIELPIVQVVVPREERQIIYMTKLGVITVKVEVQRGNGQPVQCFNCQLFGHSSSYCRAPHGASNVPGITTLDPVPKSQKHLQSAATAVKLIPQTSAVAPAVLLQENQKFRPKPDLHKVLHGVTKVAES